MESRLDMYILNSLMDDDLEFEYIWSSVNKRKNEHWKDREMRLARGTDVDFSKARVVARTMHLWIAGEYLYPYDTRLVGNSHKKVDLEDIEFDKLHRYYWELTPKGRAEVEKPEYEPYWEEVWDDE